MILPSFTPVPGDQFVILVNDGTDPISGTFAGLPNGTAFTVGGTSFLISYAGGDGGNDVVLTAIATVLTVTNTLDAGSGSFRQAILSSNALPGYQPIVFNILATGAHSIALQSPLPAITDLTSINATTQFDFVDVPVVEISGANAGAGANGLQLDAGSAGSTIRGLVLNRFDGTGIVVSTTGNTIVGNYLGVELDGTRSAKRWRWSTADPPSGRSTSSSR